MCCGTAYITLKEPSTCQDIKRACFELGFFYDLPFCNHVLKCCDAKTEGLGFNQCIGQLIPKKDDCKAIYVGIYRAFNCGEGTAAGTRQLGTKFHQDQREGHRDRQLETESHHEQQEHGRLLSSKCVRRHYNRRALSETDLVSDMKLRGDESCLEAPYIQACSASNRIASCGCRPPSRRVQLSSDRGRLWIHQGESGSTLRGWRSGSHQASHAHGAE